MLTNHGLFSGFTPSHMAARASMLMQQQQSGVSMGSHCVGRSAMGGMGGPGDSMGPNGNPMGPMGGPGESGTPMGHSENPMGSMGSSGNPMVMAGSAGTPMGMGGQGPSGNPLPMGASRQEWSQMMIQPQHQHMMRGYHPQGEYRLFFL